MHDPLTVAFEIRALGITIWHRDPEKHGDDDSCDWFGRHRPLSGKESAIVEATWDLETLLDNKPHFPDSPEHKRFQVLKDALVQWKRRGRRLHPRWHIWHWRISVVAILHLKRWLFSRCGTCGKRFHWGYAPVSTSWSGDGPRWFRGEPHTHHHACLKLSPIVSRAA